MPLYPKLYSIASAILGDSPAEAADAVQEAMVKIWRSGEAMENVRQPEPYAIMVLRSTAIDMIRRRHAAEPIETAPEPAADSVAEPDSAEFLERIIATLPQAQQEVIRLSAYECLPTDEIAAATGLKPANVRQLLSRGRKKIKELYSKYMQP